MSKSLATQAESHNQREAADQCRVVAVRFNTRHLLLALGVFLAEILIATVFAHSGFIRGYLGDFLVVILLYHCVKIFYDVAPLRLAGIVFLVATAVELAQYVHLADVLGLPAGSGWRLLIGTTFSWADLLAYGLGCAVAYGVDTRLLMRVQE